MLLQGLVDRTEVFHPLPVERLNILKLGDAEKYVNFIYDGEASLTDGRKPFTKWWADINSKITEGSRVLITGQFSYSRRDWADRFYLGGNSYDGLKNVPDLPKEGVYEVEKFTSSKSHQYKETAYKARIKELAAKGRKFKDEGVVGKKVWRTPDEITGSKDIFSIREFDEKEAITIMYMPNAETTSGWDSWKTHERKNRTRFKIEVGDDFVLNYDQIDLSDVEYYLHNRTDRENYLEMMPILKKIKAHLIKEQKNEEFFVKFVAGRNGNVPDVENKVIESVSWWKYKNKWKRPITKDDALALRMIENRINKLK